MGIKKILRKLLSYMDTFSFIYNIENKIIIKKYIYEMHVTEEEEEVQRKIDGWKRLKARAENVEYKA